MKSICTTFPWLAITIAVFAISGFSPSVVAQNMQQSFRVDTDIYTDLQQPPVQQTVTLFTQGIYYDFGDNQAGITIIIDPLQQQIVLLDTKKRVKSEVSLASLQTQIDQASNEAPQWMKEISINQWNENESEGGSITIGNAEFNYSATAIRPPEDAFAKQFADFADWSARLNAAYPPKQPPYIRLQFNRSLAEKGLMPKKITKTLRQKSVYAVASPSWGLTNDDQKRIQNAMDGRAKFTSVSPTEFFGEPTK